MATGTINATRYLKRQGLEPHRDYEAIVIDNNDPRYLGRIKGRIKGIHDGIPDQNLPWCIPRYHHTDGASPKAGMFFVPKVDAKISIRFPDADPHRPEWYGYAIDEQNVLEEWKINYPDRAVLRFSNGFFMVVDTKTHEFFINNPGDWNITILGDVNQTVVGTHTMTVTDKLSDIPPYLKRANPVLETLKANRYKQMPFKGLLKNKPGSSHYKITGDLTVEVDGDRKEIIRGNDTVIVGKSKFEKITQLHRVEGSRTEVNG